MVIFLSSFLIFQLAHFAGDIFLFIIDVKIFVRVKMSLKVIIMLTIGVIREVKHTRP